MGCTLREAVMGLRSSTQPEKNLFVSVEVGIRSSAVTFVFHKSMEDEAMGVIPTLPLVMEELIGPRAWSWFHEDARMDISGFRWDKNRGIVPTDEAEGWTKDNLEDLGEEDYKEGLSQSKYNPEIDTGPLIIDLLSPGKNQYGDNHSIKTNHFQGSTLSTMEGSSIQGLESPAWSSITGNTNAASLIERIMADPAAMALMKSKLIGEVPPKETGGEKD